MPQTGNGKLAVVRLRGSRVTFSDYQDVMVVRSFQGGSTSGAAWADEYTGSFPSLWKVTQIPSSAIKKSAGAKRLRVLPPNYAEIKTAVIRSRIMLEWEENWDGEGSPKYETATWNRGTTLLLRSIQRLWQAHRLQVDIPRISPGAAGSIDIHWRNDKYKLLLTIACDPNERANFYGENSVHEDMEGNLTTSSTFEWLLKWMLK